MGAIQRRGFHGARDPCGQNAHLLRETRMRAVVHRPTPDEDSARPWLVVAVVVASLVAGMALVRLTLSRESTPPVANATPVGTATPTPELEPAATPTAEDGPDAARDGDDTGLVADRAAPAPPEPSTSPADPSAEAAPTRRGTVPRTVARGRLAYITCEGAPLRDGPFPCPRDRPLERRVWAALEALPACPTAPSSSGTGDLRLTFRAGEAVELATHAPGGTLDGEAILSCVRGSLASATTEIRATEMVVSFRFELARNRGL
jgi:hypothetical protein